MWNYYNNNKTTYQKDDTFKNDLGVDAYIEKF